MTRLMLWPVYGFNAIGSRENLATFFTWSDAADFATHPARDGFRQRNLYMAEPYYDRRASGYRPAQEPSGYAEWCAQIDAPRADEQRRAA